MVVALLIPPVLVLCLLAVISRRAAPHIAKALLGLAAILLSVQLCWLASVALS